MGRYALFWMIVVAGVIAFPIWGYFSSMPLNLPECDPADLPGSKALHARAFGEWVLWRTLAVAGFGVVLTYLAFYLQIFHGRKAGTPLRLLVCAVAALALGVAHVWHASSWANEQLGTCLSQALDDFFAVRHVTLSDALLPSSLGWMPALYVDLVMFTLLGLVVGFGIYMFLRASIKF